MARVVNISETGMTVRLTETAYIPAHHAIRFSCAELGHIEGVVKQIQGLQIEVTFDHTSRTAANIEAYFRNYHVGQR